MQPTAAVRDACKRRTTSISTAASCTKRVRQSPAEAPELPPTHARPRHLSHAEQSLEQHWHEKLSTPGRVACLRKHASSKGLATPSPAGAKAAITMLQLTNEERLRSSVLLGDVLKSFIAKFGACIKRLKVADVVSMLGCSQGEIVNLSEILQLFGVARLDVTHQVLVWIGFDSINSSIEDIIHLSQASTTVSYKHLTARLVAFFVVQSQRSNCRRMWNLKQIMHCLTQRRMDIELTKRLRNIGSVFVELGLVQAKFLSLDLQDVSYLWLGPIPKKDNQLSDHVTPPHMFRTALTANTSIKRPLTCHTSQSTPLELIKHTLERETPQSAVFRKSSRAEIRNAVRSAIESSRKSAAKANLPTATKPTPTASSSKFVKIKICGSEDGNRMPSRKNGSAVKISGSFKFNSVGLTPVGESKDSPTVFCAKHIATNKPVTSSQKKRERGFRAAVLMSTPELSKEKTRSAVKEHLKETTTLYSKSYAHSSRTTSQTAVKAMLKPSESVNTSDATFQSLNTTEGSAPDDKKENCSHLSNPPYQHCAPSFEMAAPYINGQCYANSGLSRVFSMNSNISL